MKPKYFSNFIIGWIRDALVMASTTLTSTSVLSAYLLYANMSESRISQYLAFVPAVNLIVSLVFASITGRIKKGIPAYTVLCMLCGLLTAGFVLLFRSNLSPDTYFIVLMVLGGVLSAVVAVRIIYEYKLPCEVMELKSYSLYISVGGIISGITGIVTGMVLSFCYEKLDFFKVSCGAYLAAGLCLCAAALINALLKAIPVKETAPEKPGQREKPNILRLLADRSFRVLAVPNFIRGFGAGLISMITVLAARGIGLVESDGAIITTCTSLGSLLSCAIYGVLAPKLQASRVGMLGALVFCLLIPAFAGGRILFFVIYCVSYIGYNVVCSAIPDIIYQHISPDIMSVYHTWRLALTTFGTTVATALIGAVMATVSPTIVLAVGTIAFFLCMLAYYLYFRKSEQAEKESDQ